MRDRETPCRVRMLERRKCRTQIQSELCVRVLQIQHPWSFVTFFYSTLQYSFLREGCEGLYRKNRAWTEIFLKGTFKVYLEDFEKGYLLVMSGNHLEFR